jgi:nucleoside-diphosphate-sugar epimerase
VSYVAGDIRSADVLDAALPGCATVFHLAACKAAAADAASHYEINTIGTIRVFEACRRHGVAQLIFASTAYVYGSSRDGALSETDPAAPRNAYAVSKLGAELALMQAEGAAPARRIARLANLYGGKAAPDTVIGHALLQAAAGGPIRLRALSPVRDFLHVDDAASGLLALAGADLDPCVVLNLSTGHGTSIREMADILVRAAETEGMGPLRVVEDAALNQDTPDVLVLDSARLRALTGWRPGITLEEGLRRSLLELMAAGQVAS